MVERVELLGEEVLYRKGSYHRMRRWYRGVHPELGVIVRGYTGWETLHEIDVIKPMGTFHVTPNILQVPLRSEERKEECPDRRNVA
jgi:hypothetical protein